MTKKCSKCNKIKELDEFCKDSHKKDGLRSQCKKCLKEYNLSPKRREYQKKYSKTIEAIISRKKRTSTPEYKKTKKEYEQSEIGKTVRKIRDSSPKYKKYLKEYKKSPRHKELERKRQEKPEWRVKHNESGRQWRKNNPDKHNAKEAKRRSIKLKRTPKWLNEEHLKKIQEFYILAKELQWLSEESLEVDHIIPLQGKNISGLHVPWNLQILSNSDNCKKLNKFDGTYGNNGWKNK